MSGHPARDRLLAYIEGVTERLGAEGFAPDEEELKTKIMPSIVGSIKKLVSVRFGWDDDDPEAEVKSVSTFLVGSSVAFEFAMLTAGFLGFKGEAKVGGLMLGAVGPVQLTSYSWKTNMGMAIRSVFLEGN